MKGSGRKPPGGSRKGCPNKATASIKAAFEEAFNYLQQSDVASLRVWATQNPTEFYKLASKLIPLHVQGDARVQLQIVSEFDDPVA